MSFFDAIAAEPLQLLIPIFSGLIGWITNVLAVRMMFEPIEFVGIRPYLGWQGIIPANAVRLARTGLNLVMSKVLDMQELFIGFDGEALVRTQEAQIRARTEQLIEAKAAELFPAMWTAMAPPVKAQAKEMVFKEVMAISTQVVQDARENISDLLDVQAVVTKAVVEDKELMGRIFLTVGSSEFKFIKISGLYFGFLFGLVQLLVWIIYPASWILPLFGFMVGYATNWLALKLIFEPKEPVSVGPFRFQGLFHRRQAAISRAFADMMSSRVLSSEALFGELSHGEARDGLLTLVRTRINEAIGRWENHPMAKMVLQNPAAGGIDAMRQELEGEVEQEMFREDGVIFRLAD
jgi:uncharacterized membrane protein YheB (UPF0754 family)